MPVRGWIAVGVVLGVATTVGVAWSLALWVDVAAESQYAERHRTLSAADGFEIVAVIRQSMPGAEFVLSVVSVSADTRLLLRTAAGLGMAEGRQVETDPGDLVPRWARKAMVPALWGGAAPGPDRAAWGAAEARGWPWPALWCSFRDVAGGVRASGAVELPGRIVHKGREFAAPYPAALPLRPVWPGLAADAAVYGAAWWAVLWLVRAARGRVRRARGACARCGYDLGGLGGAAVCPECGAGVRARSARERIG